MNAVRIRLCKGFSLQNCLLLLLFFICQISFGQTPNNSSPPFYSWYDQISTGSANATNFNGIVISVATDSKGDIYLLTFADGIKKFDPQGNSLGTYIPPSRFNDPVDLEFNSKDELYVADLNEREIKFFDSNGNYNAGKNLSSDYYKPYGIAVDNEDNVYIAEYNDGSGAESNPSSRIHIFYFSGEEKEFQGPSNIHMDQPYRLDVDSNGYIYVAHAGMYPGVKVFGSDFEYEGALPYVGSPGSIVIDDEDYVHVIDYADRINFIDIINYDVDKSDLQNIRDGIKNDEFKIRIWHSFINQGNTFIFDYIKDYDTNLEMPVDLAFDSCRSKMYVNDLVLNYNSLLWFLSELDFDLEFYNRTPKLDNSQPVFTFCPSDTIEVDANEGENYAIVNYNEPEAEDNCSLTVTRTEGQDSGSQFTVGTHNIVYLAEDESENTAVCTFKIIVNPSAESPTFDCPDPTQKTILELDENCDFEVPDYSGKITNFQNFTLSPYFVQSSSRSGDILNVTIKVFDGEGGEKVGECSFPVDLEDQIPATVTCPQNIKVPYTDKKEYEIPDFTTDIEITDNCSENFTVSQSPLEGTIINEDTTVEITVIDENNNQSGCNFKIEFFKETELKILNCPGDQTFEVDDDCAYLIPDLAKTIETNIPEADVTQSIGAGLKVYGSLTLTITAKFEDQTASCEVKLIAEDNIPPSINCPGDQTEIVEGGEGFKLPNYVLQATYDDNCYIAGMRQEPDVQTVIYQTTEVTLYAVDGAGNESSCTLIVNLEEAADTEPPVFNCPDDIIVSNQLNQCSSKVDFPIPTATDNSGEAPSIRQITDFDENGNQEFSVGETEIIYEAEDAAGNTSTCSFNVLVNDTEAPQVFCIDPGQEFPLINGNLTINPEDIGAERTRDNCGIESWNVTPSSFTSTGTKTVTLTAKDIHGNTNSCTTEIEVVEGVLPFTCKSSISVQLDENGEAHLDAEDYFNGTDGLSGYSFSAEKTDFDCSDAEAVQQVEVSYSGEQNGSCVVEVEVIDFLPPVFDCPETLDINVPIGQTEAVVNFEAPSFSDNCSATLTQTGGLTSGSEFDLGEHEVEFTATDPAGNESICSFTIRVQQLENMPPSATNDEYTTRKNTTLTINAPGVLANDSDPEGDALVSVLLQQPANGQVELHEDGSFIYVPNTGFTGEDSFVYFAADDSGDDEAIVTITVKDDTGDFSCVPHLSVEVGEEGSATVPIENLYSGNDEGLQFEASPLTFTCEDIGEKSITLTYSGRLNGSCEIPVSVYDGAFPVLRLKDISIDLNPEGVATISLKDIDNGSFDNCDKNVTYTLSQSVFSCKDVGENMVIVTAKDSAGNMSTGQVRVTVYAEAGICNEPAEGSEYIFIYPNPNSGQFKVATPADVTISRMEVFDHRGRFIASKDFAEGENSYEMSIVPLQPAVYVLKINTNEGEVVKRFIFKN